MKEFYLSENWSGDDLEGKHAVMAISLGQTYHEGESLKAMVDFILAQKFGRVTLLLGDTLQAYNDAVLHKVTVSDPGKLQELQAARLKEGDAYLVRNKEQLDRLPNKELKRWNEYLNDPEFKSYRDRVDQWVLTDSGFKGAVNASVSFHVNRLFNPNPNATLDEKGKERAELLQRVVATSDKKTLKDQAKLWYSSYVLEESAVFKLISVNQKTDYMLYPVPLNDAMKYLFAKLKSENPLSLVPLPLESDESRQKNTRNQAKQQRKALSAPRTPAKSPENASPEEQSPNGSPMAVEVRGSSNGILRQFNRQPLSRQSSDGGKPGVTIETVAQVLEKLRSAKDQLQDAVSIVQATENNQMNEMFYALLQTEIGPMCNNNTPKEETAPRKARQGQN